MTESTPTDRSREWFVPRFGPQRFRVLVGLLFLPYTGMVISFGVIGAVFADPLHWDRVAALALIYFLGLGIGAHALDALGSKAVKPWGRVFTRAQLWSAALAALTAAYLVAAYYVIRHVPLLAPVAVLEGFFVFAYNLEWFGGRFHNDGWFAFSWGFLPVWAGYIMQTNRLSPVVLLPAAAMALFSLVEIKASRPYKELRRAGSERSARDTMLMWKYEAILKSVSLGVILLGCGLGLWRALG